MNCDLPERGSRTRPETAERAFLPNVVPAAGRRALVLAMTAWAFALALAVIASAQTPAASVETNKAASGFRDVEALIKEGRFETAKARLQEELQVHPSSAEAYNLLGIVYSAEKDFPSALEAFQHAAKLDPKSAKTRNNLGNTYVAQQNLDAAEREFREALRLDPANRDADYNLGLVLMARGKPREAILYLQRVPPSNTAARMNLVRACLRAKRNEEALRLAGEISAAAKNDVQVHFTLGILLAGEKQYLPAARELEAANSLKPETFEILHNLGQACLRAGQPAKAELALHQALKLKPDSAETLYLLGQLYFDQNRSVDALDALARAHKLAPENTDVIFLLARVSMTQNYFEDAIPLLEAGTKLDPKRADLRAALGESYFMSGKSDKAIGVFKELVSLDPSARSYAFLGLSYRHLGRFEEARKYFEEGLKHDPRNASCLFNLGFIEERQGNHAKAELLFQQALRANPNFSDALLELANLRVANKQYQAAALLLRRYVKLSHDPASGYYKLAMVERSLHQMDAAQRDLSVFQTLSKQPANGPLPYQHLFDYLNNRSNLAPQERAQLDLTQLTEELAKHPDEPQNLYLLAETYLKLGKAEEARKAVAKLDQVSGGDFRTQTGVGVLLARYRLYDDAIQHFQSAMRANPESDDVKFDLADAYFRKAAYSQALEIAQQVSAQGRQDNAYLSLLGDIYAHLGDAAHASEIFRDAIERNPDNDQDYLSLALVQLRSGDLAAAEATLKKGLERIPSSGKLLWGLGLVSALGGETPQAAAHFERCVELLPEWPGGYSTLGFFYYETGEIAKAREVLDRFKGSGTASGLDVSRIEEALARAPQTASTMQQPMPAQARQQLLQFALAIADRTL